MDAAVIASPRDDAPGPLDAIPHSGAPGRVPEGHPGVVFGRVGVLLVNLGTPEATDYRSMRRYLREFLSDRRVIEVPKLVWWPLLNLVILSTRPQKSGRAYDEVWNRALNESPLRTFTRSQSAQLAGRLSGETKVSVGWAMRYGLPPIEEGLEELRRKGCERLLIVPLYPQYCGATTATAIDKAAETMANTRWQAALRTLPPYHDDPAYIDALQSDITRQLSALDFMPEMLLLSFHGVPLRTLELGDPYHCHCRKTARLLGERLGKSREFAGLRIETAFQSRFGRAQWLEPATVDTLIAEAQKGTRRIAVAAPGFSADCVETLEELAIEGRDDFHKAGGEHYAVLSCLNRSDAGMQMLETIIRRELSGWI